MSRWKVFLMVNYWRLIILLTAGAAACYLLIEATVLGMAYLEIGSTRQFLITIGSSCALVILGLYSLIFIVREQFTRKDTTHRERTRKFLSRLLRRLCRRTGVPQPDLIVYHGDVFKTNAALIDVAFCKQVIVVGDDLPELLTAPQMRAVLAHECRHAGQFENRLSMALTILRGTIGLSFLSCAVHYIWCAWYLPEMGFWAGVFAVFKGWLFAHAIEFLISAAQAAMSRATEYKTDAQAAQDLGNGRDLIGGLYALEKAIEDRLPDHPRARLFATHPPIQDRERILLWMEAAKVKIGPQHASAAAAHSSAAA